MLYSGRTGVSTKGHAIGMIAELAEALNFECHLTRAVVFERANIFVQFDDTRLHMDQIWVLKL